MQTLVRVWLVLFAWVALSSLPLSAQSRRISSSQPLSLTADIERCAAQDTVNGRGPRLP